MLFTYLRETMIAGTVFLVLFAAASCVSVPNRKDVIRADEVYQQQLKEYLKTVPRDIAEEALMTVVSIMQIPNKDDSFQDRIKVNLSNTIYTDIRTVR